MADREAWRTIAIEQPRRKLPEDWFRCKHSNGSDCNECREERANFLGREHLLSGIEGDRKCNVATHRDLVADGENACGACGTQLAGTSSNPGRSEP